MKIKSSHEASQGPFVVIDEAEYDPERHEMFEDAAPKRRAKASEEGDDAGDKSAEVKPPATSSRKR
jgi:hypothetical protein